MSTEVSENGQPPLLRNHTPREAGFEVSHHDGETILGAEVLSAVLCDARIHSAQNVKHFTTRNKKKGGKIGGEGEGPREIDLQGTFAGVRLLPHNSCLPSCDASPESAADT